MEQILCCPNPDCRGTDLEYSEPDGATICMACHTIVEENAIVSSVEFNENNAGGASTVVGQFVGPEMTKAYSSAGRGRRRFYARDSRDTTLNNGRRAIQQVVSQLRLRQAFVDRACRLFRTAVERNFVQGRKTMCVVAVCLYMVCREDNSPHMLIDFSDAVQINVYVLGHAFLKFKQLTGLNLAVIDPSIYIHRFAARLELGSEQEQTKVSNLALRLVASMQRDWIQAGRRPSGICGAALYLAAIYHDKPRTYKDVGRIVRVSPDTIKKRVDEFESTPVAGTLNPEQLSNMAIQEFENLRHGVLANEADPPCYTRALQQKKVAEELEAKGAKKKAGEEDEEEEGGGGAIGRGGAAAPGKRRKRGAAAAAPMEEEAEEETDDLYKELMDELLDAEEEKAKKKEEEERIKVAAAGEGGGGGAGGGAAAGGGAQKGKASAATRNATAAAVAAPTSTRPRRGLRRAAQDGKGVGGAAAAGGPSSSTTDEGQQKEKEQQKQVQEQEGVQQQQQRQQRETQEAEGKEEEEEDDTAQYIRSDEEVAKLSKVWHEVHRTYLEKQERKRVEEEAAKRRAEEDFNYRPPTGQRKRGGGQSAHHRPMDTGQAVTNHLAKKRVSKKINYEAVKMLGADDDAEALPPELEAMLGLNSNRHRNNNNNASSSTPAPAPAEDERPAVAGGGGGGGAGGGSETGAAGSGGGGGVGAPSSSATSSARPRVGEKRKTMATPAAEGGEEDDDDDEDEGEGMEAGDDVYDGEEYI